MGRRGELPICLARISPQRRINSLLATRHVARKSLLTEGLGCAGATSFYVLPTQPYDGHK